MSSGTVFNLAVTPKIPRRLVRLEELANNLWYSWDRSTRSLFSRLHPGLWGVFGHNPKADITESPCLDQRVDLGRDEENPQREVGCLSGHEMMLILMVRPCPDPSLTVFLKVIDQTIAR